MHDEHSPVSTERSEMLGYEESDISVPVLLKWGLVLVILLLGSAAVALGIYVFLVKPIGGDQKAAYPLAQVRRLPPPGTPQLQADPVKDIKAFRSDEETRLTKSGVWKDGDGKQVNRIPVQRAMEIVVAEGLKIQPEAEAGTGVTPPALDRGQVRPEPGSAAPGPTAPAPEAYRGAGSGVESPGNSNLSPGM